MTDPYATGVLNPDVHDRLVADIDNVARDANIQPAWIWTELGKTCSPEELDWVKRFKFHREAGVAGLVYHGHLKGQAVEDRMAAIAGALTRNFIRSRVVTLNQLVSEDRNSGLVDISCLLIPNFYIEKAQGGTQAAWRVSVLLDVLLYRYAAGLQTVLSISDMKNMSSEYGLAVSKHIRSHYTITGEAA